MLRAVVRPFYRKFLERPLWWFLAILKRFFLDDIEAKVNDIDRRVRAQEATLERLNELAIQMRGVETSNTAQWHALELLILSLLQHSAPSVQTADSAALLPSQGASSILGSFQANASDNIL